MKSNLSPNVFAILNLYVLHYKFHSNLSSLRVSEFSRNIWMGELMSEQQIECDKMIKLILNVAVCFIAER